MQEAEEMRVPSLGWEDLLEIGVATHSSIHVWRICTDRRAWQATNPQGHKERVTAEAQYVFPDS